MKITPANLRILLRYDPETGKLFWNKREATMFAATPRRTPEHVCANWNSQFAGKEALTSTTSHGYRSGRIFRKTFSAHRVIWAIQTGAWPSEIDHINGDPSDNRWVNLRIATRSENTRNRGIPVSNNSGVKGVSQRRRDTKWRAHISHLGKQIHLGYFNCRTAAAFAYARASREFHGDFGRLS